MLVWLGLVVESIHGVRREFRDLQLVFYENGALLLKNHVRGADSWCIVKGTLYTMLVWRGLVVESLLGVRRTIF